MKKIQFPLEYHVGTMCIKYPDVMEKFGASSVEGNMIYADYHGDLEFTPQPAPAAPIIRNITKRAFWERLPRPARDAMRVSTDDKVLDVHEGLPLAAYVGLDSPVTKRDLDILVAAEDVPISQEYVDTVMLANGQDYEEWNGIL